MRWIDELVGFASFAAVMYLTMFLQQILPGRMHLILYNSVSNKSDLLQIDGYQVRKHLANTLRNRLMGRRGLIERSSRSPDLSLLCIVSCVEQIYDRVFDYITYSVKSVI